MWQKHGKLVAADAKGPIRTPQRSAKEVCRIRAGCDRRQHARTHRCLELVKVDEEKRQRHAVSPRRLDLAIKLLVERSMIAESGELVAQGIRQRRFVANLEISLGCDQRRDDAAHGHGGAERRHRTTDERHRIIIEDRQTQTVSDRECRDRDEHPHQQAARQRPRCRGLRLQTRACVFHRHPWCAPGPVRCGMAIPATPRIRTFVRIRYHGLA